MKSSKAILFGLLLAMLVICLMPGVAEESVLVLPAQLKQIGYEAFLGDISITSVVIPEGATHIGDYAFKDCSNLTSVIIPGSVDKIGPGAFENCSSLSNVTISEGVKEIEWSAFANCSSLRKIALPSSLENIGYGAFDGCISLTTVYAKENTPAYTWAVENGYITLEGPLKIVPTTYDGDFREDGDTLYWENLSGASNYLDLSYAAESSGAMISCDADWINLWQTSLYSTYGSFGFPVSDNFTGETREARITITLNDTVKTLILRQLPYLTIDLQAPSALVGQRTYPMEATADSLVFLPLEDIQLTWTCPDSATRMDIGVDTGYHPQDGSDGWEPSATYSAADGTLGGVKSFTVPSSWLKPDLKDCHIFIAIEDAFGHRYQSNYRFGTYDVDTPAEIGYGAYSNNPDVRNVVIPEGTTRIGSRAFYSCYNLESVTIPGTVEVIDSEAFRYCSSLKRVTINEGVKRIEWGAFSDCNLLEEVSLPRSMEYIAYDAFGYNNGMSSLRVLAEKNTYAYSWALENGYISLEGVLEIAPVLYDGTVTEDGDTLYWENLSGAGNNLNVSYAAQSSGAAISYEGDWINLWQTSLYTKGSFNFQVSDNFTGETREARITITLNDTVKTLVLRQLPYLAPEVASPSELTGHRNYPSGLANDVTLPLDDIPVTLEIPDGAVKVSVGVNTANHPQDGSDGWEPMLVHSEADGTLGESMSFVIPESWLATDDSMNYIFIRAEDAFGHAYESNYVFRVSQPNSLYDD